MDAAFVLNRAAFIASRYDRNAKDEVRYNLTSTFHLCGLIERAASLPKSGATHRRNLGEPLISEAKAAFCRAHNVVHPSVWEWDAKRTADEVREALEHSAAAAESVGGLHRFQEANLKHRCDQQDLAWAPPQAKEPASADARA